MKIVLTALFIVTFCGQPFICIAQKKSMFELEIAPVFSNRVLHLVPNSSNWRFSQYQAQSRFVSGFYFQFGFNFLENKRTRLFLGLRTLNQQVIVSRFDVYALYFDPISGEFVADGFVNSEKVDMVYLLLPVSIKQSLISKPDFRLVGEIGIASGLLLGTFSKYVVQSKRVALSSDLALSFEWKLKNGNMFGVKFPTFSYSLLPNCVNSYNINQYNYSLGLGMKLGFGKSDPSPFP